jgi:competence/damage-inducible protein CinA-like protein
MPSAEIITIGTELLLGEIVDTNSAFLARKLRDIGVDVFRTSTVGDNPARISEIIKETLSRTPIIITTGGLGPTVDDPTRDAIAMAVDVPTEFRPELWEQIVSRLEKFGRTPTENQKRQAYIPKGAIAIQNPVGTAPAFIVEKNNSAVISLPGVPREMEYLTENTVLPYLRGRYQLTGLIKTRILHIAGLGESQIDEWIGDLEMLGNPTVGLSAHPGIVDVRITAKAESNDMADSMIAKVEESLRSRLGSSIFGADDETLEKTLMSLIEKKGLSLAVVEAGLAGSLVQKLSKAQSSRFEGGEVIPEIPEDETLLDITFSELSSRNTLLALGVCLTPLTGQQDLDIVIITPEGEQSIKRSYGGHPRNGPAWAANISLELLRQELLK